MPNPDDTTDAIKPADPWPCPGCGELLDQTFDACWRCGTQRDGVATAGFEPAVEPVQHCRQCGYPLRGLSRCQCPECGAVYSPEAVQTKDTDPESPEANVAVRRALRWLIATAVSWVVFMVSVTIADSTGDVVARAGAGSIALVSLAFGLFCPIAFLLTLGGRR